MPVNAKVLDLSLQENSFYLEEAHYTELMSEKVIPYIEAYKSTGYVSTM